MNEAVISPKYILSQTKCKKLRLDSFASVTLEVNLDNSTYQELLSYVELLTQLLISIEDDLLQESDGNESDIEVLQSFREVLHYERAFLYGPTTYVGRPMGSVRQRFGRCHSVLQRHEAKWTCDSESEVTASY